MDVASADRLVEVNGVLMLAVMCCRDVGPVVAPEAVFPSDTGLGKVTDKLDVRSSCISDESGTADLRTVTVETVVETVELLAFFGDVAWGTSRSSSVGMIS